MGYCTLFKQDPPKCKALFYTVGSTFQFPLCFDSFKKYFQLGLWCLIPLSIIFQLYHGSQFSWWRKPKCLIKTTDMSQLSHWQTLSHNVVRVHLTWAAFELTIVVIALVVVNLTTIISRRVDGPVINIYYMDIFQIDNWKIGMLLNIISINYRNADMSIR